MMAAHCDFIFVMLYEEENNMSKLTDNLMNRALVENLDYYSFPLLPWEELRVKYPDCIKDSSEKEFDPFDPEDMPF